MLFFALFLVLLCFSGVSFPLSFFRKRGRGVLIASLTDFSSAVGNRFRSCLKLAVRVVGVEDLVVREEGAGNNDR